MTTRTRKKKPAIGARQVDSAVERGWVVMRCTRCHRHLQTVGNGPGMTEPQPLYAPPTADHPDAVGAMGVESAERDKHTFCTVCAEHVPDGWHSWITVAGGVEAEWNDRLLYVNEWAARSGILRDLVKLGVGFSNECSWLLVCQERTDQANDELLLADRLRLLQEQFSQAVSAEKPAIRASYDFADIAEDIGDAIAMIEERHPRRAEV